MLKSNVVPALNLRASITVEAEGLDYLEAARFQEGLQQHLKALQADFPEAWLSISERRPPTKPRNLSGDGRKTSGRLHLYED